VAWELAYCASIQEGPEETPDIALKSGCRRKRSTVSDGTRICNLRWRDWIRTKPLPNDPEAAFVGFRQKRQKMIGV